MRYIRFLKPPRLEGQAIVALITITSDLGDSFHISPINLTVTVISAAKENVILSKSIAWKPGMRSLPFSFDVGPRRTAWPIRVHVFPQQDIEQFSNREDAIDLPLVLSAWSDIVDPRNSKNQASRLIERRIPLRDHQELSIWEESGDSIARHVWDAGVALATHMAEVVANPLGDTPFSRSLLQASSSLPFRVIEVGSGCGVTGISFAQLMPTSHVILTDVPDAGALILKNISVLSSAISKRIRFIPLDWNYPIPEEIQNQSFDIALVSDCTYNSDSSGALVDTLASVAAQSPHIRIIVAMKVRHSSENVFFSLMEEAQFVLETGFKLSLPTDTNYEDEEKIEIYMFRH